MTPTEEQAFIALWQQGLEITAIAEHLGIPKGTVQSRAHRLQQRGLIQPRPKGGAYPRQKALARQDSSGVSTDTPGVSPRVSPDTPPVQYLPPSQDEMRPLLQDILLELRQLMGALATRVSTDTPQVSRDTHGVSGWVSTRTPLPTDRGKSVRWNLHLSEQLRTCIKARAEARGLQDSQMVEELLWLALSLVEESPA
jgi:DNA-binding transcriptional MocR family regulator